MAIRNLTFLLFALAFFTLASSAIADSSSYFPVTNGSHPHDVAAAPGAIQGVENSNEGCSL